MKLVVPLSELAIGEHFTVGSSIITHVNRGYMFAGGAVGTPSAVYNEGDRTILACSVSGGLKVFSCKTLATIELPDTPTIRAWLDARPKGSNDNDPLDFE